MNLKWDTPKAGVTVGTLGAAAVAHGVSADGNRWLMRVDYLEEHAVLRYPLNLRSAREWAVGQVERIYRAHIDSTAATCAHDVPVTEKCGGCDSP